MKMPLVVTSVLLAVAAVAPTAPSATAASTASVTCAASAAGTPTETTPLTGFDAISPRRLVDTRNGTGGVTEELGDGCTLRIDTTAAGVPVDAQALALSVTGIGSQPGFLSVFPCADGLPNTSNINTRADMFPTPGLVVAIPDNDGMVCIYSLFAAHLVVDLTGWWTTAGDQRLTTIAPVRVEDTRQRPGRPLIVGGNTLEISLAGVVPADATAVLANLTVTESTAPGFATAFPCGTTAPVASNLNFTAGEARAVAVAVGLGPDRTMCLQSNTDAHFVVDLSGYYSTAPDFGPTVGFEPVAGQRLADSRDGTGGWNGQQRANTVRRLHPAKEVPLPNQTTGVVVNIVAIDADDPGFVTVYPCDDEPPNSSAVNYADQDVSTNMAVVDLSPTGEICFFVHSDVHLVVDLFGVVRAPDEALVDELWFDAVTWPAFTDDGEDYVIECSANSIDMHLGLLRLTSARVNGVPVTSGVIDLPVDDDELVSVQLRRGSDVRDYYFRCVPDNFPRLIVDRPGEPTEGWYLTTLNVGGTTAQYVTILDYRGVPVWYKATDRDMLDLKRRADGRLIATPNLGPRYGVEPASGYRVFSLSGTLIDEHATVGDPLDPDTEFPTDHHDYVALPDGARALLTYPLLAEQDLTVLGDGYLADDIIADGVIQEVSADDELVWQWRTSDYFGYDEVPYPIRWGPLAGYDGNEVDPFHLNSLELVDDGSGDYVVSARHLDAVFRVDRATGDLDWILGSLPADTPNKSGALRLEVVDDPRGGPRRMHDARLDGDVLTMFDNRTDTGEPARAVAYQLDTEAGSATMLWEIEEPAGRTSLGLGSTRVADDGSVLVGWGATIQPLFEEFDAGGSSLMSITMEPAGSAYRIVKEPLSAFSAAELRATAGGVLDEP